MATTCYVLIGMREQTTWKFQLLHNFTQAFVRLRCFFQPVTKLLIVFIIGNTIHSSFAVSVVPTGSILLCLQSLMFSEPSLNQPASILAPLSLLVSAGRGSSSMSSISTSAPAGGDYRSACLVYAPKSCFPQSKYSVDTISCLAVSLIVHLIGSSCSIHDWRH